MSLRKTIFCCGCQDEVQARLTKGSEVYPHRADLAALPFWKCDTCKNFVGTHHKSTEPTKPLGVIATQEIKNARKHIHALIDPLWQKRGMPRGKLYAKMAKELGYEYHTAEIRTVEQAREVYRAAQRVMKAESLPVPKKLPPGSNNRRMVG